MSYRIINTDTSVNGTLNRVEITGATLSIHVNTDGTPTNNLTLQNSRIDPTGIVQAPQNRYNLNILNIVGTLDNRGTIKVVGSYYEGYNRTDINIGDPAHPWTSATLVNNGQIITSVFNSNLTIHGGTLVNSGRLDVGSYTKIDSDILGAGTMKFQAPQVIGWLGFSSLELDGSVCAGQKIDMTNLGTLHLGDLRDFHASILGFGPPVSKAVPYGDGVQVLADSIALTGLNATALRYNSNQNHGTLSVLGASGATLGRIDFEGSYKGADFVLSHSGTDSIITHA